MPIPSSTTRPPFPAQAAAVRTSPVASHGRAWRALLAGVALLVALLAPQADARAQSPGFTQPELEQLLAPIALYPDALLSQTLMAASYPAEVALAADWLRRNPTFKDKGDAAVRAADTQPWDPAVRSLVAFPSVLEMMDANPDWTQAVGDAFIEQREQTMSAVQSLRTRAQLAGNLQSNERWTVSSEDRTIVINNPAPRTVYVPSYNPVVVYGTWPYPTYPPMYLPPPPGYYVGTALASGIAFGVGIAVTNAIWGGFDWRRNDVNINVNNFNSIHVHNTQNYLRTGNRWELDRTHRRDVPIGDRASRERVRQTAISNRDRENFSGFDRDRPARPDVGRPSRPESRPTASRPTRPDLGAFEGLDRPDRERPAPTRPAVPSARPTPKPGPSTRPVPPVARPTVPTTRPMPTTRPTTMPSRPTPSARPAMPPRPTPSARPAMPPRPTPAARPAPRPAPAARPAQVSRPMPAGRAAHGAR